MDRSRPIGYRRSLYGLLVCRIALTRRLTDRSLALICSRLLVSTTDIAISVRACALLREIRNVMHRWICVIRNELESAQDETSCAGLRRRLCILAATCYSTFGVCPKYVSALLSDDEDFSIAIQCAIIVHANTPPHLSDDDSLYLGRILSRHRRLLHDLEPIFCRLDPTDPNEAALSQSGAYKHALSQLWLGFRGSSSWHALPRPNSQWISCVTDGGQKIHYDVLTGQLLIDGKQLGRLPEEIVKHPTYVSLLGAVGDKSFPPFLYFPDIISANF